MEAKRVSTPPLQPSPAKRSRIVQPDSPSGETTKSSLPLAQDTSHPRTSNDGTLPNPTSKGDLQTFPELDLLGLIVNRKHKLLLCKDCKSFVNPHAIRDHLKKHETQPPPSISYIKPALPLVTDLLTEPQRPSHPITPIEGLQLHPDYYGCPSCNHAWKSDPGASGCKNASCQNHKKSAKWIKTWAQRFANNTKSPFFAVLHPPIPVPEPSSQANRYQLYQRTRKHLTLESAHSIQAQDIMKRKYIVDMGWEKLLEHFHLTYKEASEIFSRSREDAPVRNYLTRAIADMLSDMQDNVQSDLFLRHEIGRRPATQHNEIHHVVHKIVSAPTLTRYARHVVYLIMFLRHAVSNSLPTLIPDRVQTLVTELWMVTAEQKEEYDITLEEEQAMHDENPLEPVDADGEPIQDHEEECVAVGNQSLLQLSETQDRVREMLRLLILFVPSNSKQATFHSPILQYIILSATHPADAWIPTSHITQNMAAVLCVCRLILSDHVITLSIENNTLHAESLKALDPALSYKTQGPMPALYTALRTIGAFKGAEQGTTYFVSPDWTATSAYNGSNIIHVSHYRNLVKTLCQEVEQELDSLLFHQPLFQIDRTQAIFDTPRHTASGYCFIDDDRNHWYGKCTLAEYMMNTDEIAEQYVDVGTTEDGAPRVTWKRHQLRRLRKIIYDLQKKLVALIMVTYGAPARGTELASHALRNVPGGSIRNFFHNFGTTFLRGSYNKTTNLTGLDQNMARAPLPEVSWLFIRFTVFIRPLYTLIQLDLFQDQKMAFDSHYRLFFGLTSPFESSDLSLCLEQASKRIIGTRINPSWHRQFTSFISTQREEEFPLKPSDSSVADQLGHTGKVDRQHYGLDANLPPNTDYQGLKKCILTSGTFHRIFGLGTEIIDNIHRLTKGTHPSPDPAQHPVHSHPSGISNHDLEVASLAMARNILPTLINSTQRVVQESHAAVVHLFCPLKIKSDTTYPGISTVVDVSPALVMRLREFFNEPNSTMGFKDHYQAQATQIAVDAQDSLLLVTATGSGKTLPGLLASRYYDAHDKVTVYIVPFNAMHEQYHKRLTDGQISNSSWTVDTTPDNTTRNLIVTCDPAVSPQFIAFLHTLIDAQRLVRVIFDEAHLILLHQNFRQVMQQLKFLGLLGVQVILLTATLPVALQPQLLEDVGLTTAIVLRGITARPNISYNIIRVSKRSEVFSNVVTIVKDLLSRTQVGKILIFCSSVGETTSFAKALGAEACFAKLGTTHIKALLERFRAGELQCIASTCVLGVGLDVPGITHVIHAGNPRNIIDFSQDTGRAGRDSNTKQAYSILVSEPLSLAVDEYSDPSVRSMMLYIENEKLCRRVALQEPLDGCALACSALGPQTHFCDICTKASNSKVQLYTLPLPSAQSRCLPAAATRTQPAPVRNLRPIQNIASTHAALTQAQPLPHSDLYRLLHRFIEKFSERCIVCHLRRNADDQHTFHQHLLSAKVNAQYLQTQRDFVSRLPAATCFHCFLPQKGYYTGLDGCNHRIHPWVDPGKSCTQAPALFEAGFSLVFVKQLSKRILPPKAGDLDYQPGRDTYFSWLSQTPAIGEPINLLTLIRTLANACHINEHMLLCAIPASDSASSGTSNLPTPSSPAVASSYTLTSGSSSSSEPQNAWLSATPSRSTRSLPQLFQTPCAKTGTKRSGTDNASTQLKRPKETPNRSSSPPYLYPPPTPISQFGKISSSATAFRTPSTGRSIYPRSTPSTYTSSPAQQLSSIDDRPRWLSKIVLGDHTKDWRSLYSLAKLFSTDGGYCASCYTLNLEDVNHDTSGCKFTKDQGELGYKEFRSSLQHTQQGICWRCNIHAGFGFQGPEDYPTPFHPECDYKNCLLGDTVLVIPYIFSKYIGSAEHSLNLKHLASILTGRPGTDNFDFTSFTMDDLKKWMRTSPTLTTNPPVLIMLEALLERRGFPNMPDFRQYRVAISSVPLPNEDGGPDHELQGGDGLDGDLA